MTLEIKKEEGEGRGKDLVVKVEEEEECCAEFREELRKTVWWGRVTRQLRRYSCTAEGNYQEGVWCLWKKTRRVSGEMRKYRKVFKGRG